MSTQCHIITGEPYVSFSATAISLESDLEAVVSGLCLDKFIDRVTSEHSFKLIVSVLQTFIFFDTYMCVVCMYVCMGQISVYMCGGQRLMSESFPVLFPLCTGLRA